MQRLLDVLLSGLALVILSPLLALVSLTLCLTGEREVIYKQVRVGKGGTTFELLKFATMLKDSPNIGSGEITVKDDPRVLPFGKFLRKSKINEIPQLWNILRGDMSIVGPRPMVPSTYSNYPVDAQKVLNTVRPGLTGVGSIIFRDEERLLDNLENTTEFYNQVITPYKSDLEIWFVGNKSTWLYCKIIVITASFFFHLAPYTIRRLKSCRYHLQN